MDEENGITHKTVKVDGETYHVVEGDLLLDIDEYDLYLESKNTERKILELEKKITSNFVSPSISRSATFQEQLIVMTVNDKIARWSPGTLLTYCVLRETFPSDELYEQTVEDIFLATKEWQATCGVVFKHLEELDNSPTVRPEGVLFPVRYFNSQGSFIASAFFPADSKRRRRLLIDPSYFTTDFRRVGIMLHEVGHILGFRHEQIHASAPAICPDEDVTGTLQLTDYDPNSVMHYFCGGVGDKDLTLTEIDRQGAQKVYGLPFDDFENITP
ncbi:MAG: hypothetical protein ACWA5R_10645 [bacterium]